MKTFILALILSAPSAALADGWATAMTPLDPRPPLPKPSEPDADTNNDGPFHAPAPAAPGPKKATVKPKAKAARPKVQTASVKSEAEPAACGCKCETCGCPEPVTFRKGNRPEVELEPRLEPIEPPAPKQATAAPKPRATDYSTDLRLTRGDDGNYYGTASNGLIYYSANPKDVVYALNNPPAVAMPQAYYGGNYTMTNYGTAPTLPCSNGQCYR